MRPADVPDGYPRDVEEWIHLDTGENVFLRPIVPGDVERIAHAFEQGDIETIRGRFFTAAPPTDRAHLEYLANVDYVKRFALLATDGEGNSIGVGRYEAIDTDTAEVAIVVENEWRRRGLGSHLLLALEPLALAQGFRSLVAFHLPENRAVEGLLMGIGYGGHRVEDGIAVLTKAID
jgi:GNAT superfamily N-acetyltransferase